MLVIWRVNNAKKRLRFYGENMVQKNPTEWKSVVQAIWGRNKMEMVIFRLKQQNEKFKIVFFGGGTSISNNAIDSNCHRKDPSCLEQECIESNIELGPKDSRNPDSTLYLAKWVNYICTKGSCIPYATCLWLQYLFNNQLPPKTCWDSFLPVFFRTASSSWENETILSLSPHPPPSGEYKSNPAGTGQ